MKLVIDTDMQSLAVDGHAALPLYSRKVFRALPDVWLKVGWNEKYAYTFSWIGRPIIQLPEDLVRIQEVIHRLRPDMIVETGVAQGGSLVYYASLMKALGSRRRVIGIDIEIRPHNRTAIEARFLPDDRAGRGQLDRSRHRGARPRGDPAGGKGDGGSRLGAPFRARPAGARDVPHDGHSRVVHRGDGRSHDRRLRHAPRHGFVEGRQPERSGARFLAAHPKFKIAEPPWEFNESALRDNVTHWPGGWLKRRA